jgi:serine/threonine protein kinase
VHKNQKKSREQKKKRRIMGTPDYLAPEIVLEHDEMTAAIDWWALGVITYEFITGSLPFNDETPEKVFANIVNQEIPWPEIGYEEDQISPEAFSFIKNLTSKDPTKRLGTNDVNQIKSHPFFHGISWDRIREQEAPFIPSTEDLLDLSYFPDNKKDFSTEDLGEQSQKHYQIFPVLII